MSTQELDRPTAGDPPPPPPAKSPKVRTMPAGRVIVVGAVALVLAAFMNSATLLDMAEGLPAGSRTRAVATDVARPLHDFASAVGLTKPREWLDSALGRDDSAPSVVAVVGPTTTTAGGATTTAPPTSAAPTVTTIRSAPDTIVLPGQDTTVAPGASAPPASQPPLPAGTTKVLIAGDSMAQGLQSMMEPLMDTAGGYQADGIAKASTGLTRPDFFDWPARLKQATADFDPGIVVLMFGGNDGQPIQDATGKYYQPTDPGWSVEYGKRVGALMDQLGNEGRRVIWVGSPIAKTANFTQRLKIINTVIEQQAATHPWVHYVDAWSLFLGPNGGWTASMTDTDGKVKKIRGGDGYHLTIDGYKRLARSVFAEVQDVKAAG